MMTPGWVARRKQQTSTAELAKQLVRLTEIIVELSLRTGTASSASSGAGRPGSRKRPRPAGAGAACPGPLPPERVTRTGRTRSTNRARARPAPPTAGATSRARSQGGRRTGGLTPKAAFRGAGGGEADTPTLEELTGRGVRGGARFAPSRNWPPDPTAAAMDRLMELDRQRRRMHKWMDAEEATDLFEPAGRAP